MAVAIEELDVDVTEQPPQQASAPAGPTPVRRDVVGELRRFVERQERLKAD
ncbi:MAG TPA: hypothetical protein VG871_06195 [Vicinamibacterales bacterium]|nr:hypothetical protein [Vicinamibacterales bacterium]